MPSPIAHSLSGVLLYLIFNAHEPKYNIPKLFLYIFFANLPDIDLVFGFLLNDPNLYHQTIFHSLGAAILAGFITNIPQMFKKELYINNSLKFILLYYSHIVLDYLGSASDTKYPFGVTLFWPLNHEHYVFPVMIFLDIWRGKSNETFFSGLFNLHNLLAIAIELAIFLPLIIISHYYIFHKKQVI